jgi:hypothetical protein
MKRFDSLVPTRRGPTVLGGVLLCAAIATRFVSANETDGSAPAELNNQGFLCHRLESALQSGPTSIRVLLPERMEPGRRYPVLYVLPVEAKDGDRYGDGWV